ncbi:hypothetical protein COV06_00935 [Candidatus Uhrbacteria bacterium CG10_big_fil_rev_8_21_14_0_10_50_16]|uniref:Uncharacterized protein n=1 Tax=Candidatus Uhrbacteria bacterium CG10_big_fil_rev_8_21_14_0_10_50_16 TaxID=1975039 RepID=A0A2H0RNQ6_9BACT|nr:MAG: hypothetical protein COV06_00935 [Candidatus Uhrbacteria bacterium CG10_big_fil_rev_8_21_14_0_10_50_16]
MQAEASTKIAGYVLASFGLVAGLAWNEAIKALIEQIFPSPSDSILAKLIYAVVVTIFVIAVTIVVTRITRRKS